MILSQKQVICTIKLLLQITDCINWLKFFVKLAQPVDFRDLCPTWVQVVSEFMKKPNPVKIMVFKLRPAPCSIRATAFTLQKKERVI